MYGYLCIIYRTPLAIYTLNKIIDMVCIYYMVIMLLCTRDHFKIILYVTIVLATRHINKLSMYIITHFLSTAPLSSLSFLILGVISNAWSCQCYSYLLVISVCLVITFWGMYYYTGSSFYSIMSLIIIRACKII